MKISVHIERLVLEGLPVSSAQGARLRGAVARELTRLLADGGIAHQGGAAASVQAPRVRFGRGERIEALGKRVAAATYCSLGGGERKAP
jgi:hypothetical protein